MRAWEMKDFIEADNELRDLIVSHETVRADYKPRSLRKSKAGLAMEHFWQSIAATKLQIAFEKKSGTSLASSQSLGRLKSAAFMVIVEYRHREGLDR